MASLESKVKQLVEMGARPAQARAALARYKDVDAAAERIFDGQFDDVPDEADASALASPAERASKDADSEDGPMSESDAEDDDGSAEEFYDSDADMDDDAVAVVVDSDPYKDIFFSKDRKQEIIEIEDPPAYASIPGTGDVRIMSQGEWMRGCPEGSEQSFLFGLYNQMSDACPCPCGAYAAPRSISSFFWLPTRFSTYTSHLRSTLQKTCPKCRKEFCIACAEPVGEKKSAHDPLFHCANIQGIVIGIGLAMVEKQLVTQEEPELSDGGNKRRMPEELNADADESSAFSFAQLKLKKQKHNKGGVGYAGDMREDTTGQTEALESQRARDRTLSQLLKDVRIFLPNLTREGGGHSSDYLVHPTTLAHLRRRLSPIINAHLRNDSLADMSDRSGLYLEIFEWLQTISHHEALAPIMAQPCMLPTTIKSVTLRPSPAGTVRERTVVYEGSAGPRELLEFIVIQATAAIKGLESTRGADEDQDEMSEEQKRRLTKDDDAKGKSTMTEFPKPQENAILLEFCHRIITTAAAIDRFLRETKGNCFMDRLQASLPSIPTESKGSNDVSFTPNADEETIKKVYIDWAQKARFEYCDLTIAPENEASDQLPQFKFFYNNEARLLVGSDIPKRSLAIAKELAVLTTNLPVAWDSSIFLRVDETRVDVIKALIIGPEGTPYQNGCYIFDIFLGGSYNQSPPSVKYLTTNGGKYRFNPNLYADGKVCLSLLGTWAGPGWVSGKSTLLQVLISIQSMILCENPRANEPAWSEDPITTPAARAYNANVRRMVVEVAMLQAIKNPPEPFEDVIRTHFRLKSGHLLKQLDDWLKEDDGRPMHDDSASASGHGGAGSGNRFKSYATELQSVLRKLSKGDPL